MKRGEKKRLRNNDIDDILGLIYLSMPKKFNTLDWECHSEITEKNLEIDIKETSKNKFTTMFIPTPNKNETYSVYKQINGNQFKALDAMKFIKGGVNINNAKILLAANLQGEGRDIVVLFPNPRNETVDIYVIEKNKYEPKNKSLGYHEALLDILNKK